MHSLQRLSLCDNKVSCLKSVSWPPTLKSLQLSNNQLSDFDEVINSLKSLKELVVLDLSCNPITSTTNYSARVRSALKSVKVLDGKDADGGEVESDCDEDEDEGDDSEFQS